MAEKEGQKVVSEIKGFKLISFEKAPKAKGAIKQEYRDIMDALKKAIAENPEVSYYEIEPPEGESLKNSVATFKGLLEECKLKGWKAGRRKNNVKFAKESETKKGKK